MDLPVKCAERLSRFRPMSRKVAAEAGDTEFARFTQIAMASASELKYYLILARDLELLSAEHHRNLTDQVDEVQKMLTSLIRKLRTKTR